MPLRGGIVVLSLTINEGKMAKKEQDFKPGDRVLYSEDGGVTKCEVVSIDFDKKTNWLSVTLKGIAAVQPSRVGIPNPVGVEFPVGKSLDVMIPFAMWEITEDDGSEAVIPNDWKRVVNLNPKGYLELNNGKRVIHGPIESIQITNTNDVEIRLKWAATIELNQSCLPIGSWRKGPDNSKIVIFPNFVIPFEIEETPEKGPRVRFGTNILYIDEIKGLDPKRVEGLNID
jgi:hypothetical protein